VTVALVFGLVAVAFSYPQRGGLIERRRGALLLVLYAAYLGTILKR
jgi:cation:H+ antiporter